MPLVIIEKVKTPDENNVLRYKIKDVNHWIQDGGDDPDGREQPPRTGQAAIDYYFEAIGSRNGISKADHYAFIKPQDPYSHGHTVAVVGDPPTDVSIIRNPEPLPAPDYRKEFEAACADCDAALVALPDTIAGKSIIANLQKEIKIIGRRLNLMNP